MATRRAEVIYVGDAASLIKASAEAKAAVKGVQDQASKKSALDKLPQLGGNVAAAWTAATPAIVGAAGALGGLTASLAAAAGGAAAVGVGAIGALATGLGSIALVAKPAAKQFSAVSTALKAYNLTLATHGTTAKQAAAAEAKLNAVVSQNGGAPVLAAVKAWDALGTSFKKLTQPAQVTMFKTIDDGLASMKSLLPTVAGIANKSMSALSSAIQVPLKMLGSGQFKSILTSLGNTFSQMIGPAVKAASLVFLGFSQIAQASGPYVVQLANGLESMAQRFDDATKNSGHLQTVIGTLVANTKSWIALIGSVGHLLVDVFSRGVSSGKGLVDSLTKVVDKWDQWAKTAQGSKDISNFFQQSAQFAKQFFSALGPVVQAMSTMSVGVLPIYVKLMSSLKGIMGPLTYAFVAYKVALVAGTVATGAWSAVTTVSKLLMNEWTLSVISATAATVAQSVATKAAAVAQTLLGAAMVAAPYVLVGAAVTALAAGFTLLMGGENAEAAAAQRVVAAKHAEAQAIQQARAATLAAADASFASLEAAQQLTNSQRALTDARKQYGEQSPQYKAALLSEHQASLSNIEAQDQLRAANEKTTKANQDAIDATNKRIAADKAEAAVLSGELNNGIARTAASISTRTAVLAKARAVMADYTSAQQKLTGVTASAAIQQFQLQRLMVGGDLITNRNSQSVANLIGVYNRLPKSVQTRLLTDNQDSLAKIGDVVGKLHGVTSMRTIAKILGDSTSAQQAIAQLTAQLNAIPGQAASVGRSAVAGLAQGMDSNIGAALSAAANVADQVTATVKAHLRVHSPSLVFVQIGKNIAQGLANGLITSTGIVANGVGQGLLYPIDAAITALQNKATALQALWQQQSNAQQRVGLVGAISQARKQAKQDAGPKETASTKSSDAASIKSAIQALKQFDVAAKQAQVLAKINIQIANLNQLKAFQDGIKSIRDQVSGLAQQAAQVWAQSQTNSINATHDAAIAAINNGPDATLLAQMQSQDTATQNAATLAGLNKNLTDAQTLAANSGGQQHLDALQQVKDAQAAIDAFNRQQTEQQLQDKITAATKSADDAQTIALNGLTQQTTDYQNSLDAQLGILTNNLQQRKISYKQWAQQVNTILTQYGLSVTTDSGTESAIDLGPGPAAGNAPTTKHKTTPKKHRANKHHRASGGPVMPGYVYTVGENGPEDVAFGHPGTVMTAAQTRQRGGGPTVNIEKFISYSSRSAKSLADRLAWRAHLGVA